jgi:hypothetical protein
MPPEPSKNKCGIFKEYALMAWDGLGFFGILDDSKIARFQGEKVTWLTPFSSCKNNFLLVLGLTISLYVITKEASKLGK